MDGREGTDIDYHKIMFEKIKEKADKVKAEHANDSVTVASEIIDPVKQKRNNEQLRTCLVASAINAMKALGIPNPPSEEEMLADLLKKDKPSETGDLGVSALFDYLESKGLVRKSVWDYPKELIEGLLAGNCALQAVPAKGARTQLHATLIAGIKINKGDIRFIEYDPNPNEPVIKEPTLDEHIDRLYKEDVLTNVWLISKKAEQPLPKSTLNSDSDKK